MNRFLGGCRLGNQRGMALVLALLAISFLVAVTVNLIRTVDWQMQSSAALHKRLAVDNGLRSGLNIARAVLALDQEANTFDSFNDEWATFDQERLAGIAGDVSLSITITDLGGKLPVNALVSSSTSASEETNSASEQDSSSEDLEEDEGDQEEDSATEQDQPNEDHVELWQRFLLSGQFAVEDIDEANAILDALIDWIDSNDDVRVDGAEDDYYQSLNPAYSSQNGEMRYLEELHLVKGLEQALLYGDDEHDGIIEYLTIANVQGKVNINTASATVLLALHPDLDEEMVSEMILFRDDEGNQDALEDISWYKQVSAVSDLTLDTNLVDVKSNSFLVEVTASLDSLQRIGRAVIERDGNSQQTILFWKVE